MFNNNCNYYMFILCIKQSKQSQKRLYCIPGGAINPMMPGGSTNPLMPGGSSGSNPMDPMGSTDSMFGGSMMGTSGTSRDSSGSSVAGMHAALFALGFLSLQDFVCFPLVYRLLV